MSEKTHESSLDHDFGFSCHGVSSVYLGEATRGIGGASDVVFQSGVSSVYLGEATRNIGGASDVVFQNGSFGLVDQNVFLKGMCHGSMGSFACHCCHLWRLEDRTTGG